ncbi:MAG TPA: hypothetical protein VG929_06535 [Actinomycetota bacterium]|nr:hypothetical protein [Actinomycetota bacterium]
MACGSTVPASQQQTAEISEDALGGDLTAGTPELPPGARVNKKGEVVSADGEVLGTAEEFGLDPETGTRTASGGGAANSSGGSGNGNGNGGASAANAPGVTSTKIYFGIPYSEAGPANRSAFGTALDNDARRPYNAMIEHVNKQGGLFGRQIEPIYYELDASSSQPIDQQEQAACAHWTEDNSVFGILSTGKILQECAERAGAISTFPTGASLPEDFHEYPHYFETSGINLIRVGNVTVEGLHRQSYFGKAPKVGIVAWDLPEYRAALERGYVPGLKSKGVTMATEPAYVSAPQSFGDLAATSSDINSAVLRFQTQGITHVFLLDGAAGLCGGACLTTLFTRRADSQEYFPRYGFNGNNQAKTGQQAGLYPARQLRGSVVVEWADADKSYDEGYKVNQARERCYALMRDAGVPMDNANRQAYARFACEQFWFFQLIESILGRAPLSSDNFMVTLNKVGSKFPSPNAYGVHFSSTQHDALAAARNMKFVNSCSCYKWTSDPYRV